MAVFFADDISNPWPDMPNSGQVKRDFILTPLTALGATAGFLASDILCLAPIPTSGFVLDDYFVDVCALDTSTGCVLDLGDNKILATAVTDTVNAQTTLPAANQTSFTLTCAASTTSFQTAGLVMVNGILIAHTGKSGSTLTGCTTGSPSLILPAGASVVECGNIGTVAASGFNNAAVIGQSSNEGYLLPWGNITQTTATAATVVAGALPVKYPKTFNIPGSNLPLAAQIGPLFFLIRIHTVPTTNPTYTTQAIRGWIAGHFLGY